jgi:hypothetical protein
MRSAWQLAIRHAAALINKPNEAERARHFAGGRKNRLAAEK